MDQIFTSHWFLIFASVVAALYWALPRGMPRKVWLALSCAVFHYHFAGPAGVTPIIVVGLITYAAGRSGSKAACVAAMVACVAALCFYKYVLFLIGTLVQPMSASLALTLSTDTRRIMPGAPPLAISFFTFEFVHYLFEVHRGGKPIRSPLQFVCFAIFFPSLVAGPIKRYTQYLPSLEESSLRAFSVEDLAVGLSRIAMGFFKKLVIADQLTLYVGSVDSHFGDLWLTTRWFVLLCIALRILFDFSGYSDIAIGTARLIGIRLPENFNWPYFASNIQEFWQRWHISLSTWIRDYIYIPLGGNRHGVLRRILNGLVAFALCGLWHGAALHFVVWGLYHGVGLVVCSTYRKIPGPGRAVAVFFDKEAAAGWIVTQLFVAFGWLIFFYPYNQAIAMARQLLGQ